MSALAGSISFFDDSGSLDKARLAVGFLKRFGATGDSQWQNGSGVLHRFEGAVTREDQFDRQPIYDEASGFAIVFDGRLDNRSEIVSILGSHLSGRHRVPDSEVVFSFLVKAGIKACSRLIGDLAFAFWDTRGKRVWLVRDAMAARPLFWIRNADSHLFFASNPLALLDCDSSVTGLNEDVLYETICGLPHRTSKSLFKGIEKVRGGELVEFTPNSVKRSFYHRFDPQQILEGIRPEEYSDALFETFQDSVRCRLRATGGIATQLSAGFDSSAVTAVAADFLANSQQGIDAFTAVPRAGFRGLTPKGCIGDEGPLAGLLADRYSNIRHHEVESANGSVLELLDRMVANCGFAPRDPFGALWDQCILEKARECGDEVMLTGALGNQTFSYDGAFYLSSLLGRLQFLKLAKEIRLNREAWGRKDLLGKCLLPHRVALKRLVSGRKRFKKFDPSVYCPIANEFARAMADEDFLAERLAVPPYRPWGDGRGMRAEYLNRHDDADFNLWSGFNGLDRRDPTADRRLAELCLALPESEFWRRGNSSHVFFRAFESLLPKEILTNKAFGYQGADWAVTAELELDKIRAFVQEMQGNQRVREYLDVDGLRFLVDSWPKSGFERRSVIRGYRTRLFWGLSLGKFLCYALAPRVA